MNLVDLFVWIVQGGGAGIVSYWFWNRLEVWFEAIAGLDRELKGYLTLILAGLIGGAAGYLMVVLAYVDSPADSKAWIEYLFSVIALSVGMSKVIHARRELS